MIYHENTVGILRQHIWKQIKSNLKFVIRLLQQIQLREIYQNSLRFTILKYLQ